jgi:hypothetical protein
VTSPTIESTYATRVSVSEENGVTVIVSRLYITASERFQTSSVTCRINHDGPRQIISFNTTGIMTIYLFLSIRSHHASVHRSVNIVHSIYYVAN